MLKACFAVLALSIAAPAMAQSSNYVSPHIRSDGTYVQGHFRTNPDSSPYNNYSTRGNINPYTGQMGTKNPYQNNQNAFQRNLERSRSRIGF